MMKICNALHNHFSVEWRGGERERNEEGFKMLHIYILFFKHNFDYG